MTDDNVTALSASRPPAPSGLVPLTPVLAPPRAVNLRPGIREGQRWPDSRFSIAAEVTSGCVEAVLLTGYNAEGGTGIHYRITPDGTVEVLEPEGWEAVVEDGMITEFRPAAQPEP